MVAENVQSNEIKVTEMLTTPYVEVSNTIEGIVSNAAYNVTINKIQPETVALNALVSQNDFLTKSNLFVVDNLLVDEKVS